MNPPELTARALAALCGVTPAAVHVARKRLTIPPAYYEQTPRGYRYHWNAVLFLGKAHQMRGLSQKEVVELHAELLHTHPAAAEILKQRAEWKKKYAARQSTTQTPPTGEG